MKHDIPRIPFSLPFIGKEEKEEVQKVLDRKWITTGPETALFEKLMRREIGCSTAVAVSSCTAALDISLAVHEVGPGEEIITTAYTFAATVMSILHRGAAPVFCDIDPETLNIDPSAIEARIRKDYRATPRGPVSLRSGRLLRGIIPVHFAGQSAGMERINRLARRHRLFVIEDAAHAAGADYRGRKIGDSDNLVCFSFYSNKNMTTAEGGMIVTNREEMEEEIRLLALHGISKNALKRYQYQMPFYDVIRPGYKANLSDLQAALGVAQIRKLGEITRRRNRVAGWYDESLAGVRQIQTPVIRPGHRSARHLYPILIRPGFEGFRDRIIAKLRERNIFPSVHFIPIHFHTFFAGHPDVDGTGLPATENAFYREISLPLYPEMTRENVSMVAGALKEIFAVLSREQEVPRKAIL